MLSGVGGGGGASWASRVVTGGGSPASRRFPAPPRRDPWVCPRSESTSTHAAVQARTLAIPLWQAFPQADRRLTRSRRCPSCSLAHRFAAQTPFCAENLQPPPGEPAPPGGCLNFYVPAFFVDMDWQPQTPVRI